MHAYMYVCLHVYESIYITFYAYIIKKENNLNVSINEDDKDSIVVYRQYTVK